MNPHNTQVSPPHPPPQPARHIRMKSRYKVKTLKKQYAKPRPLVMRTSIRNKIGIPKKFTIKITQGKHCSISINGCPATPFPHIYIGPPSTGTAGRPSRMVSEVRIADSPPQNKTSKPPRKSRSSPAFHARKEREAITRFLKRNIIRWCKHSRGGERKACTGANLLVSRRVIRSPLENSTVQTPRRNQLPHNQAARKIWKLITAHQSSHKCIHIATWNIEGCGDIMKRLQTEAILDSEEISIAAIQETKQNQNGMEAREYSRPGAFNPYKEEKFTWIFSTSVNSKDLDDAMKLKAQNKKVPLELQVKTREHLGVGFILRGDLFKKLEEIQQISSRLMKITIGLKEKTSFICAYAPTAEKDPSIKEEFYQQLEELIIADTACTTYVLGDFNARVIKKEKDEDGELLGPHTFNDGSQNPKNLRPHTLENREAFIRLCTNHRLWIVNTWFEKDITERWTFRPPGNSIDTPETPGNREQIDYILVNEKSKQDVKDIRKSTSYGLSHHDMVIAKIKFTRKYNKPLPNFNQEQRYRNKGNEDRKKKMNQEIKEFLTKKHYNPNNNTEDMYLLLTAAFQEAATKTQPKNQNLPKNHYISNRTWQVIKDKNKAFAEKDKNKVNLLNERIKELVALDKRNHLKNEINDFVSDKSRWKRIKTMKALYRASPYAKRDRFNKRVKQHQIAKATAEYLAEVQWKNPTKDMNEQEKADLASQQEFLINKIEKLTIDAESWNNGPFTIDELSEIIKQWKKDKSPGPDNITSDIIKDLDRENTLVLLQTINQWWEEGKVPLAATYARVFSLHKKGDNEMQSNYRPISLLSSIYKAYTALLQRRLSSTIDNRLAQQQFGFRKGRSTIDPLAFIRRYQENAERIGAKGLLVFLDWEKAFDRVMQNMLMKALAHFDLPAKYVNGISAIYENPQFFVEHMGRTSQTLPQEAGIRQGCPLSPYLFLLLLHVVVLITNTLMNERYPDREGYRREFTPVDHLLFADDTVLIPTDEDDAENYLEILEEVASNFGLKLNQEKCVVIALSQAREIKFRSGKIIQNDSATTYLGASINNTADQDKELGRRIAEATFVWNKLLHAWKEASLSIKKRTIIFHAVIRAKVAYGLETVRLTPKNIRRLDTFYYRGLRRILDVPSTYIDRQYSNQWLLEEINKHFEPRQGAPRVITLSQFIANQAIKRLGDIMRANEAVHLVKAMHFAEDNAKPTETHTRRKGRPRDHWVELTSKAAWDKHQLGLNSDTLVNTPFNKKDNDHWAILFAAASTGTF
eukprot:TRINITY_DN6578_c0_g1_i1.p1 TRINITY_DN6578_c0_g1~~TRINITY_DN6578_c0_g1_i1.p1  ORF type:complete len:1328 (+),score=-43.05 TRINITY_DN6578_c0_g1_i1:198-3986(+)